MIADEVDDGERIFALLSPQATTQLLQEDDRRLRRTKHQDRVDIRNVKSLVEDVDCEDDLKVAATKSLDRLVAGGRAC